MDMNTAYDEMLTLLEKEIYNVDVDFTIENSGIGAYEYWGAKGYDNGTDSLLIEEPSIVSVKLLNWSKRLLVKIANDIIFEDDSVYGSIIYRHEPFKISGKVDSFTVKNGVVTFTIVWDEEQEG